MNPTITDIEDLIREAPGLDRVSFHERRLSELMQGGLSSTEIVALIDADSDLRNWMQQPLGAYGLEAGALWRHSLATAITVDLSSSFSRVPVLPSAFAAALLHDAGKLVLSSRLDDTDTTRLRRAKKNQRLSDDQAEMEILKLCHGDLGAHLAARWGLSEVAVQGIRHHHSPILAPTAEARRVAAQVALGDAVAQEVGAGCGSGARTKPFTAAIAGLLSISREGFRALCHEVEHHLDEGVETIAA